jgi:UDP-N-acetylmuramoyl-L-alanyl-D-glutamate--2,6-diaminopimelate ligase
MGAAAARLADDVIVTSDNPRSEDPAAIVAEILTGVSGEGAAARVRSIVDRAEAIAAAVGACEPGDALLIAGKGHETYQILGDRTIEFDDRAVALKALRARGYAA